jgi:diaminohydroxyphosphoribosylaminopyrimidine deaminase/5-amino-6-(5-phosphoribosylamino)uracil reductase
MGEKTDCFYMKSALELAAKAKGKTSPNPLVGAIVVKDNKVIGAGYHPFAGGPHAEVEALNQAGSQARDAVLYVTLEPCNHYGRTPPCTERIIASGIKRVVIGHEDPNPLVSGKGIQRLKSAGIDVTSDVLSAEAKKLNEVFIKYITTGKPFVLAKGAISLDGRIATRTGHSNWITGEEARFKVHELRNQYDAILVGIGTVLADDPLLTTRLPEGDGKDPIRIILDSRCRIPLTAQVLKPNPQGATIVVVSEGISWEKLEQLEKLGIRVLKVSENNGKLDLKVLLVELGKLGITSLLVEGGAGINGSFFANSLVDKVCLFVAPKIIGGDGAKSWLEGWGVNRVDEAVTLKDLIVEKCGQDLVLVGYPEYGRGGA